MTKPTPTDKHLETAIEIVSEYFGFPIDDPDVSNFERMPDCVPKSIVKDISRALAEAAGRKSAMPSREEFISWAVREHKSNHVLITDVYDWLASRIEGEK
jgi:hypothetical protein